MKDSDRAEMERGKQSSRRGSTDNKGRLEAFARVGTKGGGDWGGCSPDKLQGVIMGITELGGAVTFGLSRDKGAHSLTLMLDDNRTTLWFNGDAELDSELNGVLMTLKGVT